jgi:hypothetical protein
LAHVAGAGSAVLVSTLLTDQPEIDIMPAIFYGID